MDSNTNGICDKDETQTKEEQTVTCKNECNFETEGECYDNSFYLCYDKNGDGCKEKEFLDFCGPDYTCISQFTCVNPKENTVYEIRSFGVLQGVVGSKNIEKGTTYTTQIITKEGGLPTPVQCEVLKTQKALWASHAIVGCEEIPSL